MVLGRKHDRINLSYLSNDALERKYLSCQRERDRVKIRKEATKRGISF